MRILFFALLTFFLQSEINAQQKNFNKKGYNAPIVEVVNTLETNLYSLTPTYGRIISLEPYAIISKVSEEVKKIFVLEGAEVSKGQKLIQLESKNIKRLISRYEAENLYNQDILKLLNEELLIIDKKLKRFLSLKKNKVISNATYDNLIIKKINLNKQISKVEFELKSLYFLLLSTREDLNNTIIKSPISGNLINLNVRLGSNLKKGAILGSVLDPKNNEIETFLRSNLALKLKPGFPVQIINEDLIFNSSIRAIIASENIKTGSRLLKIKLPKSFPKKINVPNKRIEIKIPINDGKTKLIIPKDGLIAEGQKKIVYIVRNNKVLKRNVILGQSFKEQIEVKSGLIKGDLVVVKGNENIRPNQFVRIKIQKK